jgi:DNA-binding HxlR family transcriptional regulator
MDCSQSLVSMVSDSSRQTPQHRRQRYEPDVVRLAIIALLDIRFLFHPLAKCKCREIYLGLPSDCKQRIMGAVESTKVKRETRSGCPINLTLEMLGDGWSLIVIRDIMFGNRRHYGDLVRLSEEGIASNILANRLARLVQSGLLSRADDPTHKQKAIYSLTEASIQLVPLLAHMGAWGCRHTSSSRELSIRAQLLEKGGERMWKAFMAELRSIHLGAPAPRRSVSTELEAAFESAVSREAKTRTGSKTR